MQRLLDDPGLRTALLALLVTGCSSGGGSGGQTAPAATGSIAGTLSVFQAGPSLFEAEPNDDASQAHVLGALMPGESVSIFGHLTDDGSDPLDAFRIQAPARSLVQVSLTAVNPAQPVDFDLFVADAISLQGVELFQSSTPNVESGSFVAQGSFFLVATAFTGAADYELSIDVSAAPDPLPEVETNDVPGDAMFLGELVPGSQLRIVGDLGQAADADDRFLVAFPATGQFSFTLDSLSAQAQDFDVDLSDATADLLNPVFQQTFNSPSDPEVGAFFVAPMTLLEIRLHPFQAASGPYSLTLSMAAGPQPLAAAGTPALSPAPRGDRATAGARLRSVGAARFFGAPVAELVTGDVLVGLVGGLPDAAFVPTVTARGGRIVQRVPGGVQRAAFDLPSGLDAIDRQRYTLALAASLAGAPNVAYAEPNGIHHPFDTEPNDAFYNLQWHYDLIRLPAAWDLTVGSNNVIVAVIDTGTVPAPDLVPRVIAGFDMIGDAQNAGDGDGYDGDPTDVGDSNGPQNSSFHGAHVMGTVGASTDDGLGVAGTTWATRLMPIRVLGFQGGSDFDIASAIRYAARLQNASGQLPAQAADVMNLSLGRPGTSQTLQAAVSAARNAGTLVVAAAGNDNSNAIFVPASLNGVISVSAVDAVANKAPYSNFHPTIDIAAPGGDISVDRTGDGNPDGVLSVRPNDTVSPTDLGTYAFYNGTSMAAPHVAGVAALVLAVDPTLSVAQLENILLQSTTDLGAPGRDDVYGEGLLNAFAAVQMALGGPPQAPSLSLSTTSLQLTQAASSKSILVSNGGGGQLQVTGVGATTQTGGAWLSATAVPSGNTTSTDTARIDVVANTAGLADGLYGGTIAVQSNGGSANVSVSLSIASGGGGGQNYTVFVLAVDVDTFATEAQAVVQTQGALSYSFPALAVGDFLIVAGTDEDDDGFICDDGEPLCGVYPTMDEPTILTIVDGAALGAIDFAVLQEFTSAGQAGPTLGRTFALLPGVRTR